VPQVSSDEFLFIINDKVKIYRERMQLEMVKFLLQQHPILFKQTGFKVKHADKMGLANDLHLIFKKKDLATKSVSLRNYFQILQELIHGMSSFKD